MRQILVMILAGLLLSCGQSNKKPANTDSILPSSAVATTPSDSSHMAGSMDTIAIAKNTTDTTATKIEKNGIADWTDFWLIMKAAIIAKDTAAIVGLTHFPFFINSSLSPLDDFKEVCIEQLFNMNLKKAGQPHFEGNREFSGRDDQTNTSGHLTCDSTFYLYVPHLIVYFGKVKGYYKLLGMETPG